MKTMIKKAGYFLALLALTACESFDFEQEMGQKIICIYRYARPQRNRKNRIYLHQLRRFPSNRPGCGRNTGICSGSIAEL